MLYIVGTPIGNLFDLSLRQAETLISADLVLAEDTRSAQTLLSKAPALFKLQSRVDQKIISYYKENEFEKLPEILEILRLNKSVVLISESGMPLISDPGYLLLKEVIKQGLAYTVIPGPTALVTALVHSGFKSKSFMFLSFLPKKESELKQIIEKIIKVNKLDKKTVFIFYESPKRINKTLTLLDQNVPEAEVVICREITKKFEEIARGKPKELLERNYKGEITVILKI